ncbi:DUF3015 family protein [Desulfogranum mediterraneum]|uniref:DUF3015 family protein n=1 Tax=Desulfogranum mediterraneum TaxID=160661 RepID=UPI000429A5F1|nr:DUF3015 family protein [Desulfogranum mediterraneum]
MKSVNSINAVLSVLFALALLSGCATTTAPTESSTKTFDKTTNAALDLTSSTSPGSSGSGSAGVAAFTRANYAALQAEMAAGSGEHLAALAGLLQIPAQEQPAFFQTVQQEYGWLYPAAGTSPEQMLAALRISLGRAELSSQAL